MPFAALPPQAYYDPDVFAKERSELFAKLWIFAGMANEIASSNDYFRIQVAGRDVIVQNCSGTLRAFVNSCSHRHSRIHEPLKGNRKLICPYHGWTYDDEGIPVGIPQRENFPEVCANPARFALRRLELQCAGHFIFVRAEPGGPSLREFLGHAWDFLVQASAGLHTNMDDFSGDLEANWKTVIENALEGYHVPIVHRSTLGSITQFSQQKDEIVDHLPDSGHSYMINRANAEWLRKWKRFDAELGTWRFKFDHYVHRLIFPNLTVTSFMGYSFHVQHFHPEAPGKTTVRSRIYSVCFDGQTEAGSRIMNAVYAESRSFTHDVFAEDQRACELAYSGVQQAGRPALLANDLEKRIANFHATYNRVMGSLDRERTSEVVASKGLSNTAATNIGTN